jgi:hypothetical protein
MRRTVAVLAVLSLGFVLALSAPSSAQTTIPPTTTTTTTVPTPPDLTVTGTAVCATNAYTITWSLTDTSDTTVEFMGGELSGAATGPVDFSPSVIDPGGTMTGVVSVAGTTTGTVTVTVSTLIGNIGPADYTGTVTLAGTCVQAAAAPAAQAQATFTG